MEWIKNLKINQKLQVLLTIATAVSLLIGLVGYLYVQKGSNAMADMYDNTVQPTSYIAGFGFNTINGGVLTYDYITTKSPARRAQIKEELGKFIGENNTYMEKYEKLNLSNEEKDAYKSLKENIIAYRPFRKQAMALADAGKVDAALAVLKQNDATLQTALSYVYKMKEIAATKATEINAQNTKSSRTSTIILVTTILVGLGLLITIGLMISNMITKPIQKAITDLNVETDGVTSASAQVAAASQQLAESTTEQASSVQETSSTLEETSSMVHQNRENTQQAAVLAKQARQYAEKSNSEMSKLSTSMTDLKTSSNEIAKIIKVIDEIAFQTNILSLNAAVEAARAGDAGKGFAVVAEEVRNLAQRSAQAAKDTAVIIDGNVNLSVSSFDIAKAVRESVEAIEDQAGKVSDLLDEISVATNEQAQGVEQIAKAVSQMEEVLGTNAQTAEEAASASCSLSDQAINVKEVVGNLILLVNGAEALRNQAQRPKVLSTIPPRRTSGGQNHKAKTSISTSKKGQSPENIIPLGADF